MVKFTAAFVAFTLIVSGCAATSTPQTTVTADEVAPTSDASIESDQDAGEVDELEAIGDIEVDRNLLTVEVTIPASLVDETDIDELIAEFAATGISIRDAQRNADGSVTYRMSRVDHRRLLSELRASFEESFDEAAVDFPSVQAITFNTDVTRFRIVVDRPAFENSFDGFIVFLPLFAAGFYAAFDGRDPEGMRIEIDYVDFATGQVFDTFIAPDDLPE